VAFSNDVPQDWSTIFDELRQKESLNSDAKLAEALGVTSGYICSVRKGRKRVSLKLATAIFSRLGRSFQAERMESLFVPSKVRARVTNLGALRRQVISHANGNCELCGMPAPFNDLDGQPYLEVHHLVPLHTGGDDSLPNLVALCPNCHRKVQVAPTATDARKLSLLAKRLKQHQPG